MPFRDREWEAFQRDCDFFPAYADYLFGVDTRPEIADELGLHPQLHEPPTPPQHLYGLPPPMQDSIAYNPVRDATQTRPYSTPTLESTSLLRQESSMESMLPTPCPAPRILPSTGAPIALLRSNELITDPQYSTIPLQERVATNLYITQAWSIMNSDAIPPQKVKAMGYIKNMSRVAAVKRQHYQAREAERLEAEMQAGQEWELHDGTCQTGAEQQAMTLQQHASPPYSAFMSSESRRAKANAEDAAECVSAVHEYAIYDLSQLPAYMQSHLPQLWTCTEIIALHAPPTDPGQLDVHQQAQQYMIGFMQSVPPGGRQWINVVIDEMIKLRKQGGDPMTVLQGAPRVEDVVEMRTGAAARTGASV